MLIRLRYFFSFSRENADKLSLHFYSYLLRSFINNLQNDFELIK